MKQIYFFLSLLGIGGVLTADQRIDQLAQAAELIAAMKSKTSKNIVLQNAHLISNNIHKNALDNDAHAKDIWNNLNQQKQKDIIDYGGTNAILDFINAAPSPSKLNLFLRNIEDLVNKAKQSGVLKNANLITDNKQKDALDNDTTAKNAWNQLSNEQRKDIVTHGGSDAITDFIQAAQDATKLQNFLKKIDDEAKKNIKVPPKITKIILKKDDINALVKVVDPLAVNNKGDLFDILTDINKDDKGLMMEVLVEHVNKNGDSDIKQAFKDKDTLKKFSDEVKKVKIDDANAYKANVINALKNAEKQGIDKGFGNILGGKKSDFMGAELKDLQKAISDNKISDIKNNAQKLKDVLEKKAGDVSNLSKADKKVLVDILQKVSKITNIDVKDLVLDIKPPIETTVTVVDCSDYDTWLSEKEGQDVAKEVKNAHDLLAKKIKNIKSENATDYKGNPNQIFKKALITLYSSADESAAMKRIEFINRHNQIEEPNEYNKRHKVMLSIINPVVQALGNIETTGVDKDILFNDLVVFGLLVPSQLHAIVDFLNLQAVLKTIKDPGKVTTLEDAIALINKTDNKKFAKNDLDAVIAYLNKKYNKGLITQDDVLKKISDEYNSGKKFLNIQQAYDKIKAIDKKEFKKLDDVIPYLNKKYNLGLQDENEVIDLVNDNYKQKLTTAQQVIDLINKNENEKFTTLGQVVAFLSKKDGVNYFKESRDLIKLIYEINIYDVTRFIETIKNQTILNDGQRRDVDTALSFYPYIKPYLDEAEFINNKDEFVKDINLLNKYLMAILCKHQKLLVNSGFDFRLLIDISEDETQRSWCGLHDPVDTIITAPGGRRITYKSGSVKGFGPNENQSEGFEVDSSGRRVRENPKEWKPVSKKNKFYYAYFVYLQEMVNYIEKYNAEKSNLPKSVRKTIEEFIVSRMNKFYNYYAIATGLEGCVNYNNISICDYCFNRDLMGNYGGGYNLQPQIYANGTIKSDIETIIERSLQIKNDLLDIQKFLIQLLESRQKNNEPDADVAKAVDGVKKLIAYKKKLAKDMKSVSGWVKQPNEDDKKIAFEAFKKEFE